MGDADFRPIGWGLPLPVPDRLGSAGLARIAVTRAGLLPLLGLLRFAIGWLDGWEVIPARAGRYCVGNC